LLIAAPSTAGVGSPSSGYLGVALDDGEQPLEVRR
jgi:hypothetical protein